MKTAQLYWYAKCSQCRDARKELERGAYTVQARDFFREPFSESELRSLLAKFKLKPREVFSFKSPSVRAMKLHPGDLSDEEMISLMVREPRLLRRPLIVIDGQMQVGFSRSKEIE